MLSTTVVFLMLLLIGHGLCQCFTDTDCKGNVIAASSERDCCFETDDGLSFLSNGVCTGCAVPIKIGFTQRTRTISEADVPQAEDILFTRLPVTVERAPKQTQHLVFRLIQSNATVVSWLSIDLSYDALFGVSYDPEDPLVDARLISPGETALRNDVIVNIRNDFVIEEEECFTIGIFNEELSDSVQFTCNDEDDATNFFCVHTICIEDDDEPFVVGFVQTVYTVLEGTGSVEVCVQLTEPVIDILDETVRVHVINHPTSIYVPADATLATADEPDSLGRFSMEPGTDFAAQTLTHNIIDDEELMELRRIVCYNQTIYDDTLVEGQEYIGLSLGIRESTAVTEVRTGYDQAAILIVDDDVPLKIGFTQRIQTVSEADVPSGDDLSLLQIPVTADRISERDHRLVFHLLESRSTALNVDHNFPSAAFDAIIGFRSSPESQITVYYDLRRGESELPFPLRIFIRNDFLIEDEECFSIRLMSADVANSAQFTCNDDESGATNFFCEHTICIEDDDEPFVVAFVQTAYTVVESIGSVEVCINLTRPHIDILDESVNAFVTDFPTSVYIPAGAPLASPDPPDFSGRYSRISGSDYTQQTNAFNIIDDKSITEVTRVVCYNQMIYDDTVFEETEYFGLSLGVSDGPLTTVVAETKPMYDQAVIVIIDNDAAPTSIAPPPVPGNIANVRRTSCGVLTWDVPSDSSEGLTYKIRFYGGQSFGSTPSSQKKVLASPTNSLAFTAEDVPSTRPLYAIVKARNSDGVHSHSWSSPAIVAVTGCP